MPAINSEEIEVPTGTRSTKAEAAPSPKRIKTATRETTEIKEKPTVTQSKWGFTITKTTLLKKIMPSIRNRTIGITRTKIKGETSVSLIKMTESLKRTFKEILKTDKSSRSPNIRVILQPTLRRKRECTARILRVTGNLMVRRWRRWTGPTTALRTRRQIIMNLCRRRTNSSMRAIMFSKMMMNIRFFCFQRMLQRSSRSQLNRTVAPKIIRRASMITASVRTVRGKTIPSPSHTTTRDQWTSSKRWSKASRTRSRMDLASTSQLASMAANSLNTCPICPFRQLTWPSCPVSRSLSTRSSLNAQKKWVWSILLIF